VGAVLNLRDVRQRLAGREVLRLAALDVEAGERLAVLGPNGAGKTTLLRLLAAINPPSGGEVLIDGVSTRTGGVALRRQVAYATQRPGLLHTTALRNVELPLRWRGAPRRRRRVLALAALDRLGVEHLADRPAYSLSGGEMQRVSLSRALVTEPSLLLLDEPAAGLDPESRAAFLADVEHALADRATTVVHVSHQAEEALRLADRVAVLVAGELRQLDTPAGLTGRPNDATVARLVGYDNVLEASIDQDGEVRVEGQSVGLSHADLPGPATLAVWADGVRLGSPDERGLRRSVTRVTPGPGRWEVGLDGPDHLRAHLPLRFAPPVPGQPLAVTFDPDLVAIIATHRDSRAAATPVTPRRP
jgi:ABC-type Fe3+/spermidine/putrescine transport system ATPase subunit